MSYVDRFIEVQGWPTSRKTALLCAFLLPITIFNTAFAYYLLEPLDWFDVTRTVWLGALLAAHWAFAGLVAWAVGRRGHEGTWTFYLMAAGFVPLMAMLLWEFGAVTTAMLIFVPLSVLNVVVLFDDRLGRHTIIIATVTVAIGLVVALTGWATYAPAFGQGDLSLLGEPRFLLALGGIAVTSSAAIFVVAWAEVSAARRTSERLDAAQRLIARYVPHEVAEDIMLGRLSDADGHHRRKLTVFFSDLVGFSDIAEELEPEDLAMVLNEYFGEMTAIAHRHHGTVDELQGDALLILFGAPRATTDREHALNAVRMAAEMHEAMDRLNAQWRRAGITETLAVRMGVNTGVVTVGNFGTPTRLKYAALGKHVNVAARLQAIAEPGSTVISYATYLLVQEEIPCRSLGLQQLKGITKPVEAYALG